MNGYYWTGSHVYFCQNNNKCIREPKPSIPCTEDTIGKLTIDNTSSENRVVMCLNYYNNKAITAPLNNIINNDYIIGTDSNFNPTYHNYFTLITITDKSVIIRENTGK